MGSVFAVMRKELISYFSSYIAYILVALFLLIAGYFFYAGTIVFGHGSLEGVYGNTLIVLLFLMPLITMRLLSEERKTGSFELLLTKPVTEVHIVVGKFLAALTLWFLMVLPTALYGVLLYVFADPKPDVLVLMTQSLSLFLVGAAFIAVGLFASSLTENQMVAAFLAFSFMLLLWLLNWVASSVGAAQWLEYFTISNYIDDLLKGVVDVRDIVFYLSFMAFWLYAAVMRLYARRLT